MQRDDETVKLLAKGKLFVRFCSDFNSLNDIAVLNALINCGILEF